MLCIYFDSLYTPIHILFLDLLAATDSLYGDRSENFEQLTLACLWREPITFFPTEKCSTRLTKFPLQKSLLWSNFHHWSIRRIIKDMSQLSLKFHHILYLLNLCRNISQQHHIIARKFIRLGSSPTKGLTTSCDVSRAQDLLPATLHRPRQNRTEQGQRTICLRREIRSN